MNDFENEFELPMRNLLGTKINLLNFCHFEKQNEKILGMSHVAT